MTNSMKKDLYLDDVAIGDRFTTGERAVDAAEILAFAEIFDPQPFHLDEVLAAKSFFGGLAASGWHTASITMGLLVTSGLPLAGGLIGAGAELLWPSATRPGDVLHVEAEVTDVVRSRSREDRGIVTFCCRTLTSLGDERQTLTARLLVFRRL